MILRAFSSRAGDIDRPIRKSASGRAKAIAVVASSTPMSREAMASVVLGPPSSCTNRPEAAIVAPSSAAASSTVNALNVGSLVCLR